MDPSTSSNYQRLAKILSYKAGEYYKRKKLFLQFVKTVSELKSRLNDTLNVQVHAPEGNRAPFTFMDHEFCITFRVFVSGDKLVHGKMTISELVNPATLAYQDIKDIYFDEQGNASNDQESLTFSLHKDEDVFYLFLDALNKWAMNAFNVMHFQEEYSIFSR